MLKFHVLLISLLFTSSVVQAQSWKELHSDEIYALSRTEAFDGKYAAAKEKLSFLLTKTDHADARILLGTILSWEGDYTNARSILKGVFHLYPDNIDVIIALANTDLWDNELSDALGLIEYGLAVENENETLLIMKARILVRLQRADAAIQTMNKLLALNPDHNEANALKRELRIASRKYTVGITHTVDLFSRIYSPSRFISLQAGYENNKAPVVCRLNFNNRFEQHGLQYEADLYPKLSRSLYAYLNYGYSGSVLFPRHRAGGDLFLKLPRSFELSGGARYLDFRRANEVLLYNASVGKYHKRLLGTVKGFIGQSDDRKNSYAGSLLFKHFIQGADNYLSFSGTFGFMPDNRRIQNLVDVSSNTNSLLKTQTISFAYQRVIFRTWIASTLAEVTRQEVTHEGINHLWVTSLGVGLRKKI